MTPPRIAPVPDTGRSGLLARRFPGVRHEIHEHANHLLPLSDLVWCRALIEQVTSPDGDRLPAQRRGGNRGHERDQLK